ncbi:Ail/Lom family outer membrane beta-barrel protein [Pragia fontium]|uniref:Putatice virulence related protein PagC n=2 Tax=Pragia fontium TaxID=82985 RepID=A0AAJ4WDA4_9GAMM|nr:Ail/Lom family outer membrane beta-barrel protein [Pragia fontium]AKJ43491.1 virulence protein [Pragia fontium]GKX64189.1 virulence-related membrane protein [Pragia fontium]SFD37713.1 putatice virulence related protein PagC [Pragia fontium DSM 5563 = ATCC 49100]VEJ56878.1 Outer membrane protein X precursor [Pragia fontium]
MKKILLASIISLSVCGMVNAGEHTVTLGYAQSKVQDFDDINGVNVKYRYEWDSPLSIISSFTYMKGDKDMSYRAYRDIIKTKAEVKYYSISAGPAYRFNDFVSIYGLMGVNVNDVDYSSKWYNADSSSYSYSGTLHSSQTKSTLMYGAGLQINPVTNLAIDVGYEGSRMDVDGKNYSINGFNVGLGYRF